MALQKAKISNRVIFTDDVIELTFETAEPFNFIAGQFITIKIADKVPPCFRAYSISSAPTKDGHHISTCLKIVEGGRGSNWLAALKIGDELEFLGPNGKFLFKEDNKDSFFIATGTGITPLKSMIEDELAKGNKGKIELLFGLRHIKNVFYHDLFEKLKSEHQNFNYSITLSKPEDDSWQGETGRVTDILRARNLDTKNTNYYICGLKDMINEVESILREKGVPEENIHSEKFD